jgi:Domain of unknown function (DUF1877)
MTGELYRISASRLAGLLGDPAKIEAELFPGDYPVNMDKHGLSVEKTWNAIEFTLDRLAESRTIPWIGPLTEGTATGCVLHYGPVWYRTPAEVTDIAHVLIDISRDGLHSAFVPDLMAKHSVYPDIWAEDDKDGLFDYVWQHFEQMVRFYRAAADDGDAVLLYLG